MKLPSWRIPFSFSRGLKGPFLTLARKETPTRSVRSSGRREFDDNLENFFARYKDKHEDAILAEGIEALCADLSISTLDPVTLVIAFHCRAKTMGIFTKAEFVRGMCQLGCDEVDKLKMKLAEFQA